MSAQKGPDHDDRAHKALLSDLQSLGHKVTETDGKYGYPEKSFMIEHQGRAEDHSALDALARKYHQQSILHSSFKASKEKKGAHHNELRYMDGSPSVFGRGYRVDTSLDDNYTDHPGIGRFQMHLDFDSKDASKALAPSMPVSGQAAAAGPPARVAPAAISSPQKIINPPRPKFVKAPIVSSKTPAVSPKAVESPTKPPSSKPKQPKVALAKRDLIKAIMHQDGETMIDSRAHAAAVASLPKSMMDWGTAHLVPMKISDVKSLKLGDCILKVTKKSPDLYAGWIEIEANIGHKFERLTMPQLLIQLQSALEAYGKEDEIFGDPSKTEVKAIEDQVEPKKEPEKKKELTDVGQAISNAIDEAKDLSEADRQAKIRERLEELRAKVKSEVIPAKDLAEGLEEPEKECPACEAQAEECSCYEGLTTPRLEFDGRKVTIFFKSDWSAEDKDNFKEDLKRRAGIILRKREEARSVALEKAKKLIDTVRKNKR